MRMKSRPQRTTRSYHECSAAHNRTNVQSVHPGEQFSSRAPRVTLSDVLAWILFTAVVVIIIVAFCLLTTVIA